MNLIRLSIDDSPDLQDYLRKKEIGDSCTATVVATIDRVTDTEATLSIKSFMFKRKPGDGKPEALSDGDDLPESDPADMFIKDSDEGGQDEAEENY